MQNVNATGTNHGKHHAYAYGHARKNEAVNFKEFIDSAEDKATAAKNFKSIISIVEEKSILNDDLK